MFALGGTRPRRISRSEPQHCRNSAPPARRRLVGAARRLRDRRARRGCRDRHAARRRRRPSGSPTSRSPSRTATTPRCSPRRRRPREGRAPRSRSSMRTTTRRRSSRSCRPRRRRSSTTRSSSSRSSAPAWSATSSRRSRTRIKVVNMDQELGAEPLDGEAAGARASPGTSSSCRRTIGTKLGKLVVKACAAKNLNPCNVGYLYDIKASALDVAIRSGFNKAVAGHEHREGRRRGRELLHAAKGLAAVQTMLQAHARHQPDRRLRPGHRGRRPGAVDQRR